jgi:hypothetical protein
VVTSQCINAYVCVGMLSYLTLLTIIFEILGDISLQNSNDSFNLLALLLFISRKSEWLFLRFES